MEPDEWVGVRRSLVSRRPALTAVADARYPAAARAAGTPLLTRPSWIPPRPVPLDSVRLAWEPSPAPPAVSGTGAAVLPAGFATYAEAIEGLARPALFEDRPCYRLLSADLSRGLLSFGPGTYFAALNVGETAAHELAAGVPGLPFRESVGDPTDLSRRCAVPAVSTLTVRREPGRSRFVLHWRDPAKVAHAGGLFQVMPVGVFQPAGSDDFDLWRCVAREYSEEFLGRPEHSAVDYASWPFFQALEAARRSGGLAVHCLGLGVDPLTFATDLLAVAVFDAEIFDGLFRDLVTTNAEGEVSLAPFTEEGIAGASPMQPAGLAALRLAFAHRAALGL